MTIFEWKIVVITVKRWKESSYKEFAMLIGKKCNTLPI